MRQSIGLGPLLALVAAVPRLAAAVSVAVADAMEDGRVTADEGEQIGRRVSDLSGDLLDIRIRGVDVVDADAQADILGGIGRIAARILSARAG